MEFKTDFSGEVNSLMVVRFNEKSLSSKGTEFSSFKLHRRNVYKEKSIEPSKERDTISNIILDKEANRFSYIKHTYIRGHEMLLVMISNIL